VQRPAVEWLEQSLCQTGTRHRRAGHQHRRFSPIDDPVLQCVDRSADGGAIKIEGTISRVRWINPHTRCIARVPSA
jgi:hypothetical protein